MTKGVDNSRCQFEWNNLIQMDKRSEWITDSEPIRAVWLDL